MLGKTYENRVPLAKLCAQLGISRQTANRWVRTGRVRAWLTAGVWYVSLAQAEALVSLAALRRSQGRARTTCPVFKTPEMG